MDITEYEKERAALTNLEMEYECKLRRIRAEKEELDRRFNNGNRNK